MRDRVPKGLRALQLERPNAEYLEVVITMTETEIQEALKQEEALADELTKYTGDWVAIADTKVIAHAATFEELAKNVELENVNRFFQVAEESVVGAFY